MSFLRFYIIFVGCFCSTLINARWLTPKEAPIAVSEQRRITVASDGSSKEEIETSYEILNELGRHGYATIKINYDGSSEQIENISAATYIGKNCYPVDKKDIENKTLASSQLGFENKHQILIAFPKVQVGAVLKVTYRKKAQRIIFDHYELFERFLDVNYKKLQINISSALPLHLRVNDPTKSFRIKTNNQGKNIQIKLSRPLCFMQFTVVDTKPNNAIFAYENTPWISISSLNNWDELVAIHRLHWQKVCTAKLPNIFQKIAHEAAKQKTETAQITFVISHLEKKLRYMGTWNTSENGYIPRDFQVIAKTGFGDCKDFTAVTTAILRKLGFEAYPAVVAAGYTEPDWSKTILPGFTAGNHAIVWAKGRSGKVYWLDPTNICMTDIFPPIADRPAIVLRNKDFLQRIPSVNYKTTQQIIERHWQIIDQQNLLEKGTLKLQGARAVPFYSAINFYSPNTIKERLFQDVITNGEPFVNDKHTMHLPQLKTNIVQDLSIQYQIPRQAPLWPTNHDPVLLISLPSVIDDILKIDTALSCDFLITTYPITIKQVTKIPNIVVTNIDKLNYTIVSPWLTLKRIANFAKGTLHVEDTAIVHKNCVTNNELHSAAFKKLQNELRLHTRELIQYRQVK